MKLAEILKETAGLDTNEKVILAGRVFGVAFQEMQTQRPRVPGQADAALKNFDTLRTALAVCVSSGCFMPALMLTYAGMDIAGAMYAPTEEYKASGAKFREWVARFILPSLNNQVSAQELYAARCGMLHVYSSSSTASPTAPVGREISYVGYTLEKELCIASLQAMTVSGQRADLSGFVVLSIQELVVAFDAGWLQMLHEVLTDSTKRPLFERHCAEQFNHVSMPIDPAAS